MPHLSPPGRRRRDRRLDLGSPEPESAVDGSARVLTAGQRCEGPYAARLCKARTRVPSRGLRFDQGRLQKSVPVHDTTRALPRAGCSELLESGYGRPRIFWYPALILDRAAFTANRNADEGARRADAMPRCPLPSAHRSAPHPIALMPCSPLIVPRGVRV